jgi:drug/metabolite transporter (DMT)-like permease
MTLASFPPCIFAGVREVLAGIFLIFFARWRGLGRPSKGQLKTLFAIGLLIAGVSNGLTFWGQKRLAASHSALLFASMPFFAAIFGPLFLRGERMTLWRLAGLAVGFSGVWLVLMDRLHNLPGQGVSGQMALIGASVTWALGIVLNKLLLRGTDITLMTGVQLFAGSLFLLLISWAMGESWSDIEITAQSITLFLITLVGQGCIAYLLYYWVMVRVSPTILALTSFVSPAIAVILGVLILGEHGSWQMALGLLAIGTGILIVNRLGQQRRLPTVSPPS